GGSGGGECDAVSGASAADAGGAGNPGGEQGVRGRGDYGDYAEPADGVGRNAERATLPERRPDATAPGSDQALRGRTGGDSGSTGGRQHDGRADDAVGKRRGGAHGGERTNDTADGDARGGHERSDGDPAELRGYGHIYEREWRQGDGLADERVAANGAQREGVRRGVRRRDGRYERAAGRAELWQRARRGAGASRRHLQDADAELARGVNWRIGKTGFGAAGISGRGRAGERTGRAEHDE